MKILISFILLCVSPAVIAWECGEYDRSNVSLGKHFEVATEVFFGTVVKGEVDIGKAFGHDLEFIVNPTLKIKGEVAKSVRLISSSKPPFNPVILGANYLIFLYGSNEIDFCGIFFEVPRVSNKEELHELANRNDLLLSRRIRELISNYEAQP